MQTCRLCKLFHETDGGLLLSTYYRVLPDWWEKPFPSPVFSTRDHLLPEKPGHILIPFSYGAWLHSIHSIGAFYVYGRTRELKVRHEPGGSFIGICSNKRCQPCRWPACGISCR